MRTSLFRTRNNLGFLERVTERRSVQGLFSVFYVMPLAFGGYPR
jgi:hypothetical protein